MSDPALPERVRRLVEGSIRSVAELELLLLARRTRPRAWTAEQASDALRTSVTSATAGLGGLERKGLLTRREDGYAYVAAGALDVAVAELERAYGTHRTRIVELIYR